MNKKNISLGVIFVVLVALAYLYQGPFKHWQTTKNKPVNFLSKLSVDKIDKITIGDKTPQVLVKKDTNWFLQAKIDQPASSTKIADLLDQLRTATVANVELISSNSAKKADFKTDVSGTKLALSANGIELASFVAGKLTNDFQSSYLCKTYSNETFAFKGVKLYPILIDKNWAAIQVKK